MTDTDATPEADAAGGASEPELATGAAVLSATSGAAVPEPSGVPTMFDVARRAGVSHQTVSRVLNDLTGVAASTRIRVEQAIADLSYTPSPAARAMATRRSGSIGLIQAGRPDYGPSNAALGFNEAAHEAGLHGDAGEHALPRRRGAAAGRPSARAAARRGDRAHLGRARRGRRAHRHRRGRAARGRRLGGHARPAPRVDGPVRGCAARHRAPRRAGSPGDPARRGPRRLDGCRRAAPRLDGRHACSRARGAPADRGRLARGIR